MFLHLNQRWVYAEECVKVNGQWRGNSRWEKERGQWVLRRDARNWALQELKWEASHFWEGLEGKL